MGKVRDELKKMKREDGSAASGSGNPAREALRTMRRPTKANMDPMQSPQKTLQKSRREEMEEELAALRKSYTPGAAFGGRTDEDRETLKRINYLQNQLRLEESEDYYTGVQERMAQLDEETVGYLDQLREGKPQTIANMQGVADNRSWEEVYAEEQAWEETVRQMLREKGYDDSRIAQMADDRQRQVNRENYEAEVAASVAEAEKNGVKASLKSVPQNLTGGLGSLSLAAQNAHKALTGDERPVDYYTPEMVGQAKAQAARQTVSKRLEENTEFSTKLTGNVASFLYNTGMSMADSAAAALVGGITGSTAAGAALLGGTAATQAAVDAKERGVSDGQALFTGLAAGAAEAVFEKLSLGNLLESKPVRGTLRQRIVGTLKEAGLQAGVEGSEELFTTVANTLTDAIINGDGSAYRQSVYDYMEQGYSESEATKLATQDWIRGLAQDFLGGAISGGVMGGGKVAAQTAAETAGIGRALRGAEGALAQERRAQQASDRLAQRVLERMEPKQGIFDETKGKRLAPDGKKVTNLERRELLERNMQAANRAAEQAKVDAVATRLKELGEEGDEGRLAKTAKAVIREAAGEKRAVQAITGGDRALAKSKYGRQVAQELRDGAEWTKAIPAKVTYGQEIDRMGGMATNPDATDQRQVTGSKYNPDTGKMDAIVKSEDGTTAVIPMKKAAATVRQVALAEEAAVYGKDGSAMMAAIRPEQEVDTYARQWRIAYEYGLGGMPEATAMKSTAMSHLTEGQRQMAYEMGQRAAKEKAEQNAKERAVRSAKPRGRGTVSMKGAVIDGVRYQAVDEKCLPKKQRDSVQYMKVLARETGINVVFYESLATETGRLGANGVYLDNTIYLDIAAGVDHLELAQAAILRTAGHELTHFIQDMDEEAYNKVKEFVLDKLTEKEGVDLETLVQRQMAKNRQLSHDEAIDEVVADACEMMLKDSAVLEELAQKDKSLAEKIVKFLRDLMQRLRAAFEGVEARSEEAKAMADYAQELQKIWDAALRAAVENGGETKNTAENGGVAQYSLAGRRTPTYEELTQKKPVHIVDVTGGIASGSYADMKKAVNEKTAKEGWFGEPHHNEDTDSLIFLTEKSFTHAYSNLRADFGEDTIRAMAHIPEVIRDARLLHVDGPKNPMKAETKVYTFIGAIKGVNGVEPVKLTVKEYDSASISMIPENIRAYFEKNGIADSYESLYDAHALEVIGIEGIKKEPDASGEVNGETPQARATSDSEIRVADLLALVNGDAQKYIPQKKAKGKKSLRAVEDADVLEQAAAMKRAGQSREEIWKATGLVQDASGTWVTEIDDSSMKIFPGGDALLANDPDYQRYMQLASEGDFFGEEYRKLRERFKPKGGKKTLEQFVQHDELFRYFPALRNVEFVFRDLGGEGRGYWSAAANAIVLDESLKKGINSRQLSRSAIHEIQHAMQSMEGRAGGSNKSYWEKKLREGYRRGKNDTRIQEADAEYRRLFDNAPEDVKRVVREINRAYLAKDYDRAAELADSMEGTEHEDAFWAIDEADFTRRMLRDSNEEMTAAELYENTAGELEARSVAQRLLMTAEERREKLPGLGWDEAVIADGGGKYSARDAATAYDRWNVESALWDALDHKDDGRDNLILVGGLPRFVVDKLGIEGDFYIYRNHAYENMVSKERAVEEGRFNDRAHYHNLGIEVMADAIMALEDPVAAIAAKTKEGNPAVIAILPVMGKNKAPLYAVLSFYSSKDINGDYSRRPHVVLTVAERNLVEEKGRTGTIDIVNNAVKDGRIISYDKKKRDYLSVKTKATSLSIVTEQSLEKNITRFWKEINTFRERNNIRYSLRDTEITDRDILAATLESAGQTESEKKALEMYRRHAAELAGLERELAVQRQKLQDHERPADDPRRKVLSAVELTQARNRAASYARQIDQKNRILKPMEKRADLQAVLERERAYIEEALNGDVEAYKGRYAPSLERKLADQWVQARTWERRYREAAAQNVGGERAKRRARKAQLRKDIREGAAKLADMLVTNTDKKHVPEDLKVPLAEFLDAVNLNSPRLVAGRAATRWDMNYGEKLARVKEVLDKRTAAITGGGSISDYLDLPTEFAERLQDHIDEARRVMESLQPGETVLSEMSVEQLETLHMILSVLKRSIETVNSLMANRRFKAVDDAAKADLAYMRELGAGGGSQLTAAGKAEGFLSWTNLLPVYAFRKLGKGAQSIFEGLQDGWDKLAKNAEQVIRFTEQTYKPEEAKAWTEEVHEVELHDPVTNEPSKVYLTTAQIMSLWALSQREQALGHIVGDADSPGMGIRPEDIVLPKSRKHPLGKTIRQDKHFRVDATDIYKITDLLTDRQLEVARALQGFMEKQGSEWGNEVSMERHGYLFFGEKNYFPIETDSQDRRTRSMEQGSENDMYRLLNISATKALMKHAKNAIMVRNIFDVYSNHMADMAKYNALALPLLDAIKWYNWADNIGGTVIEGAGDVTLKRQITETFGKAANQYIVQFVRDMNGVKEGGGIGEGLNKALISNYKRASVAANLRVALLQPTSYVRAGAVIDAKYLTRAANAMVKSKDAAKEMREHSGIALWKSMGFFDTDVGRSMREQIRGTQGKLDRLVEWSMIAAEKGDEKTWAAIWTACKLEQTDKGLKGEELMGATADRFREVVYATQVVDSTMTRSGIMRSRTTFNKLATSFMSEPTVSYNMIMEVVDKIRADMRKGKGMNLRMAVKKNAKAAEIAFGSYAATALASAVVESLFDALRDDDDEKFIDKLLAAFGGNLMDNLNVLDNIPVLKDILALLEGDTTERMDLQGAATMVTALMQWQERFRVKTGRQEEYTKLTNYGNQTTYGTVYQTARGLSYLSGIPLAALMREAQAAWNNTFAAVWPGLKWKTYENKGDVSAQNMYEAMLEGDEAAWEKESGKWQERLIKEGSAQREALSTVRSGVKQKLRNDYYVGAVEAENVEEYLMDWLGMNEDEAKAQRLEWTCYVETGIKYTDIRSMYERSEIERSEVLDLRMKYGQETKEEAESKAKWYDWGKEYPTYADLAEKKANGWYNYVERTGMSPERYYELAMEAAEQDVNSKAELVAFIRKQSLPATQQKALWRALKTSTWKDTGTPWG